MLADLQLPKASHQKSMAFAVFIAFLLLPFLSLNNLASYFQPLVGYLDQPLPPLVRVPLSQTFAFSTFYGGTRTEQGFAVAVDAASNMFVTGFTNSANFPVLNPFQDQLKGNADAFVAKLSPEGRPIWATYLGGSGNDSGVDIAVDSEGAVYILGSTGSVDFPVKNSFFPALGGEADCFLVKLNNEGNQILYASVFGGSAVESPRALATDSLNNVWLTGVSQSTDFPLLHPLQSQSRGRDEAFLIKISRNHEPIFSTYLGGNGDDRPTNALACDAKGDVYLAGATNSSDFPITAGVVQPNKRDEFDAFITKIKTDGTSLLYSTYLGGRSSDGVSSLALNTEGEAYVTGGTLSTDFPVTSGAFQPAYAGGAALGGDAFVTRLDAQGQTLRFSTYLGGAGPDQPNSIAVDLSGYAYVAGRTSHVGLVTAPPTFPLVSPLLAAYGGGFSDGFLTCVNPAGTALVFSTFLGGRDSDTADAVAVDLKHNVYVTGGTASDNFPITNPVQPSLAGSLFDAFALKIQNELVATSLVSASAASYSREGVASESIVASFGMGLAPMTQVASTLPLPVSLAGSHAVITDSIGKSFAADLFYVSSGQVNFHVPAGVANGLATVSLFSADNKLARGNVSITSLAPGLFAANANGQGVAAAVALRLGANGSQNYEPVARFDTAQNRFVSIPIDLGEHRGAETDRVFLVLFGTGIRHLESLAQVTVKIGGVSSEASYAGAQGALLGLDQVNILLPRALSGKGEVEIEFLAHEKAANKVSIFVK